MTDADLSHIKIRRFTRLTPFLYRGAVPRCDELPLLKAIGVHSLVDFQDRPDYREKKVAEEIGLQYIAIPWNAIFYRSLNYRYVAHIAERFLEVLAQKENLPVYVHCYHGRERTGTMIAVYRMAIDGWTYEKARDEMLGFGVSYWLNVPLFLFLRKFRSLLPNQEAK